MGEAIGTDVVPRVGAVERMGAIDSVGSVGKLTRLCDNAPCLPCHPSTTTQKKLPPRAQFEPLEAATTMFSYNPLH